MRNAIMALMTGALVGLSGGATAMDFPQGKTLAVDLSLTIIFANEAPYTRKHSQAEVRRAVEELRQYVKHDSVLKNGKAKITESYDQNHWVVHLSARPERLSFGEVVETHAAVEMFLQGHHVLGSSCWHVGEHASDHEKTLHCVAR